MKKDKNGGVIRPVSTTPGDQQQRSGDDIRRVKWNPAADEVPSKSEWQYQGSG